MLVLWSAHAIKRREEIFDYIAQEDPQSAIGLDLDFEEAIRNLQTFPDLGKPGRIDQTRELVVRNRYIIVYRKAGETLEIVTIRHAAQLYPPR